MEQSRDDLIIENMNLVYGALHKYYPTFAFDEDIIQWGMVGLIKAADTYDASKSKFSTYAVRVILNEIRMELRRRRSIVPEISLSQEIALGEDKVTLEDSLCGDEDIDYVDKAELTVGLTDDEKKMLGLTLKGLSQREIASKMGCSQPTVGRTLRKIKSKWRGSL